MTKKLLKKLYLKEKKNCREIGDILGCCKSTISNKLRFFNIVTRIGYPPKGIIMPCTKIISREVLIKFYLVEKKQMSLIAKICNCSKTQVWKLLKKFNIPTRKYGSWKSGWNTIDTSKRRKMYKKRIKTLKNNNYNFSPWNKGLTKKTDSRVKQISESYKKTHKDFSGKNNPFYGKKHTQSFKRKQSLNKGGTGIPYENSKYPSEWNDNLKKEIRSRDDWKCQLTGITNEEHIVLYGRQLDVHHIDYNTKNCNTDNLITLSAESHRRTNYNRDYWKDYFLSYHKQRM